MRTHCKGRAHTPERGSHGRGSSNQDRARGSQEGERFGVRPLAAEHQLLMASRKHISSIWGFRFTVFGIQAPAWWFWCQGWLCWRKNMPRALRSLSRARPWTARKPPLCSGEHGSNGTAAGVLVGFHSPNSMWSPRKAESLEQHLLPSVWEMKTEWLQHARSWLLPLLLAFLNTKLKPSEQSRGAAVADVNTTQKDRACTLGENPPAQPAGPEILKQEWH